MTDRGGTKELGLVLVTVSYCIARTWRVAADARMAVLEAVQP